ncbi:MAG TPA: glycoside hydrolase family 3 N-terminal domain-containing protein [Jatrophihabitantaceae bacterium]|jgi:beta-N-acetylhexosaminidase
MNISDSPVSRRSVLAAGAAVVGGLGLAGGIDVAGGIRPARAAARPAALTLTQQAGQRVIFSYPGLTPPSSLLNQISAGQVGGVIFFGENIQSLDQIAGVVDQLVAAQRSSPISSPLLLMTDQEGGQVRRLPGAPTMSEKQVGASADPVAAATAAGTGAAQNLNGVGMNCNLAPVLDVYRTAGDFDDQYGRSYSSDPNVAAECGAACVTAHLQQRVAPTGKHFPGLGSATKNQNTDATTVTLTVSLSNLRNIDEVPFRSAISAGVPLIMTSWAIYPALDSTRPAGLSSTIVGSELRQRLGFTGVTITDALEAGALNAYGTSSQRGVLAAQAGMDLLLCSARDVSQGQSTVTALVNAVNQGQLDSATFTSAVNRVLMLRNTVS